MLTPYLFVPTLAYLLVEFVKHKVKLCVVGVGACLRCRQVYGKQKLPVSV